MDPNAAIDAAATELTCLAKRLGIELAPLCDHGAFVKDRRWIYLWRQEGEVRYNMQGSISELPKCLRGSESAFQQMWHESGRLPDIDMALDFVRAWLLDHVEVDQLPFPKRYIKRAGI